MRLPLTFLLLSLAASAGARADCVMPTDNVGIPDGTSASLDQMTAALEEVNAYRAELAEYRDCLDKEREALEKGKAEAEVLALNITRFNAAVDAETRIGERMNEQIRAYNAAQNDD